METGPETPFPETEPRSQCYESVLRARPRQTVEKNKVYVKRLPVTKFARGDRNAQVLQQYLGGVQLGLHVEGFHHLELEEFSEKKLLTPRRAVIDLAHQDVSPQLFDLSVFH